MTSDLSILTEKFKNFSSGVNKITCRCAFCSDKFYVTVSFIFFITNNSLVEPK